MAQEEQVLVIERKVFDSLGAFHGLAFDVDRYLDAFFVAGVPRFIPRVDAENDPSFKQLIPYVIMRSGDKYLNYVRGTRAGETRLVGKRSIGIGGHINPVDQTSVEAGDFRDAYLAAVKREVDEEVNVDTGYSNSVVALLNDDTSEVGKVHLGIVHLWDLEAPNVTKREQMITQLTFMTAAQLHEVRDTLETWSSLCVEKLDEMTRCIA
jgi:predicted NUDIX family phosphoesterase